MLMLLAGLLLLGYAARSRLIERHLNRLIAWVLQRWGHLTVRDHVAILQLEKGYAVSELVVEPQDWLAGRTLLVLKLPQEGVLVLGIRREEGAYPGTPTADMEIHAGDVLVLYGPIHRIEELDQRRKVLVNRGYRSTGSSSLFPPMRAARVMDSPAIDPGDRDVEFVAQVDGCVVEALMSWDRRGHPPV